MRSPAANTEAKSSAAEDGPALRLPEPQFPNLYFGPLMRRADSLEKTLMLGKIGKQEKKGTTEDELVGWHHRLKGHEFEQALGDGDGQGGLVSCDSWDCPGGHNHRGCWSTVAQAFQGF